MSEWIVKQNTDGQLEVVGLLVRCENCKKAKTCEWYFTNGLKNGYCDRGEADALARQIADLSLDTYAVRYGISVDALENAPTIDALPIIRCKECKYSKCIEHDDDWWECQHDKRVNHSDGYCNWAERKEE